MTETGDQSVRPVLCQPEETPAVEPERANDAVWLARGSLITLGGGVAGRALQVGGQVALARLLGPAAFGLYAIGWALLRVANIFTPLGLDNGVVHCATRYAATDHRRLGTVLRESVALAMLFGGFVGLMMCIAAPVLATRVFGKSGLPPVIYLFAAGVPLAAGLRVASASTTVSQSIKYSVYAETLTQPAANLALIFCFYLIGWRLLGTVAAAVVSFGAGLALALYYGWRLFPQARLWSAPRSASARRELLEFSMIAWLGAAFLNLVPWVDRLFVGAYLMPVQVGVYQAAAQASVLLGVIAGALNVVATPRISFLYQSSQVERLHRVYKVAAKWMLYTSVPFLLAFCFAPGPVLGALYGGSYTSGSRPLIILSMMRLIDAVAGPVGILLIFTGRQTLFSVIAGCGLALCTALNYLLVPHFGASGAALATGLANTVMMAAMLLAVRARLGVWPWDRRWLKGLAASAAAAGALLYARPMAVGPPLLGVALTLLLSAAVFAGGLVILRLDEEDREMLRAVKVRLLALAQGA